MARRFALPLVVLTVFVAACGSSSKSSNSSTATTAASPNTAYSYGSSTTPTSAAAASGPVLQTAKNTTLHKRIIVDANGKTVDIYKPDETSTTSNVPAALKAAWPPVTSTESNPTVARGLRSAKMKVNAQDQISYDGHLLYTFTADTKPGDAKGQGLGNVWYVLSADGAPIT